MGLWKTLGKIGLIAGGAVATGMTGGAASPLLAAAIGAGTGAGVGAIDGGWKGAAKGAALGGVTGGIGGGALGNTAAKVVGGGATGAGGQAVSQGFGGALRSAAMNPQVLAAIGRTVGAGTQQAAQNRSAMTEAQLFRDQIALQAQRDHEQALIQRAKLEMEQKEADAKAREGAGNAALRADQIRNWQPANRPGRVANISFVQRPGEGGQAAAKEMERQALLRQLQGEQFTPLAPMAGPYAVSDVQRAGTMEKIGNILAPSLMIAAALRKQAGAESDHDQNWTA